MRILLIDVNCKGSSTGEIVYNLYSFLNKNNHEAAVCYGRGQQIDENNIYKFGLDWETYLHALLTRITGYTGCYSYFSTRRLINFIELFNPDIVHIHELHAYFINIKQLLDYLAEKRIKVVHTLHCEFSYTGKCGHSIDCEKWKENCGKCPHLRDYPKSLFFDHTSFMKEQKRTSFNKINSLIITAPSSWLADRARNSFFRRRDVLEIHNGVDASIFYPRDVNETRTKYGFEANKKIVISVGSNLMSENKGGKYIIQLANELKDVLFILIGSNNRPHQKENIIDLGEISDKNTLADYYSLSDMFVICSKRENFPTTCLEAQLCGTPICGFDTGGIKETCLMGSGTNFVEYGNVNGIKEIIIREGLKNKKNSDYIADIAKKEFGIERSMEEYLKVYETLN